MIRWIGSAVAGAMLMLAMPAAHAQTAADLTPADYRADAAELDGVIVANYAYPERFVGGVPPRSAILDAERDAVHDRASLLAYAEHALFALADHHAITGSSFSSSWAVVPSFADLWIVRDGDGYRVDAVREGSPAEAAGIVAGQRLVAVDGVPIDEAVAGFWRDIGIVPTPEHLAFAARVLAAGRRDRFRVLTFADGKGAVRTHALANLYGRQPERPPVTVTRGPGGTVRIRFNNSLGDNDTIAAFDAAMADVPANAPVIIDLTDTPGGGNTVVGRAVMGWFVQRPTAYQVHNYPAEERETGIPRQWIEQALPRAGKYHPGPVSVRVGRWTGSMGEGIAIGFDAMGKPVHGSRMAGLRGAIYDFRLSKSGLVVKLPAERLMATDGTPREDFVPQQ